jgi:hypothetical protein
VEVHPRPSPSGFLLQRRSTPGGVRGDPTELVEHCGPSRVNVYLLQKWINEHLRGSAPSTTSDHPGWSGHASGAPGQSGLRPCTDHRSWLPYLTVSSLLHRKWGLICDPVPSRHLGVCAAVIGKHLLSSAGNVRTVVKWQGHEKSWLQGCSPFEWESPTQPRFPWHCTLVTEPFRADPRKC